MKQNMRRDYQPVKRERAEDYVFVMLVSFAITVVATRLFLELTGYPRIANGELHIAHVLWGGLLLFVAVLILLVVINRWALWIGAALAGIGVGLFIDEVGKFITSSNDYFFPFAAPIIYITFLLVTFVYLQVRQLRKDDSRSLLYWVFDDMGEILDHDLDLKELERVKTRLQAVRAQAAPPDHLKIAEALLAYLEAETLSLVQTNPGLISRSLAWFKHVEARWFDRRRMKTGLVVMLGVFGLVGFIQLILTFMAFIVPEMLNRIALESLITQPQVSGVASLGWFLVTLFLEGFSGFLMFLGALFLVLNRDIISMRLGFWGLVIALTIVNVLLFYFNQFATVSLAVMQFLILLTLIRYQARFLRSQDAHAHYRGFSS